MLTNDELIEIMQRYPEKKPHVFNYQDARSDVVALVTEIIAQGGEIIHYKKTMEKLSAFLQEQGFEDASKTNEDLITGIID